MQQILLFLQLMKQKGIFLNKNVRQAQLNSNLASLKRKQGYTKPCLSSEPRNLNSHRKIDQNFGVGIEVPHNPLLFNKPFSKSYAPSTLHIRHYLKEKIHQNTLNNLFIQKTEASQAHEHSFLISQRPNILEINKEVNKENLQQKNEVKLRKTGLKRLAQKPKFNNGNIEQRPTQEIEKRLEIMQKELKKQGEQIETGKSTIKCQEEKMSEMKQELQDAQKMAQKLLKENTDIHIQYRSQLQTLKDQLSQNQTKMQILQEQLKERQSQICCFWVAQLQKPK